MRPPPPGSHRSQGFTLAEVAVTIVIVGIALLLMVQSLNTAKMTAAQTRNYKRARELALLTMGQIEAGLFEDGELDSGSSQTYAEEGEPYFYWEVAMGDETFDDENDQQTDRFDAWNKDDRRNKEDEEEDDEESKQEWEEVTLRVTFPKILEYSNQYTIERWIPWEQVYPDSAEDDANSKGSSK